jgi:site-specific DNA-methyltransferase (adenine-specific)
MSEDVKIIQGNCLDVLKEIDDGSIDLIITDPGYESIEIHRYGGKNNIRKMSTKDGWWSEPFKNESYASLFCELYRVLKKDSHLYMFADTATKIMVMSGYDVIKKKSYGPPPWLVAGFDFANDLVWVRSKRDIEADRLVLENVWFRMGYHYRKSKDFILFFQKGKRKIRSFGIPDVLPYRPPTGGFPTQKPDALIGVLMRMSSVKGETVLDVFAGSGVVGRVARKSNRKAILIDLDTSGIKL